MVHISPTIYSRFKNKIKNETEDMVYDGTFLSVQDDAMMSKTTKESPNFLRLMEKVVCDKLYAFAGQLFQSISIPSKQRLAFPRVAPLLMLIILINDLVNSVDNRSRNLLFADDNKIFMQISSFKTRSHLLETINLVGQWCLLNKLQAQSQDIDEGKEWRDSL